MKKILIIILSLLILCSCGSKVSMPDDNAASSNDLAASEDNSNKDTSEEGTKVETSLSDFRGSGAGMSYEEVKNKYPDKKILIWAVQAGVGDIPTEAVNEYLDSLGKDYVVCFEPVGVYFGGEPYIESVLDHINAGKQIDIVHSGLVVAGDTAYTNSYSAFVFNDIFADISERLTETECGRALYDLMPEKYWDSLRVDGKIYGVDGNMSCVTPPRYVIYDKAIVEKYGFDTSKPVFSQSDEILEIVKKEDCQGVVMVDYDLCNVQNISVGTAWNMTYFDETEGCFKSLLDNEAYYEFLKTVYEMTKNGSSVYGSDAREAKKYELAWVTANIGSCESGKYYGGDSELRDAIVVELLPATISNASAASGICSDSEYPEEAFELLCLSQTDKYLCELLSYGVEENRVYTDDGAINMPERFYECLRFINYMICTPTYNTEFITSKDSMLTAFENGKVDPLIGFSLNTSKIVFEFQKCDKILDDYYGSRMVLRIKESESFEDFIETFRAKLKKAGIDEVIEESNIQYEMWRKGADDTVE